MKKLLLMTALVCLGALSAFAQSNFGGKWTLDASKSKLDERMRIESMTLDVTQTDKDITITTTTKRMPPPADAAGGMGGGQRPPGGGGGMGGGMRGGMGGDGTTTYTLDGKEVSKDVEGPMGKQAVATKGEIKEGKLSISSSRTFNGQMGEMKLTTKETWSLSSDGKTLTVKRDSESPRGTQSSEMVFTKQ